MHAGTCSGPWEWEEMDWIELILVKKNNSKGKILTPPLHFCSEETTLLKCPGAKHYIPPRSPRCCSVTDAVLSPLCAGQEGWKEMNFSPGGQLQHNTVIIILDCWATKIPRPTRLHSFLQCYEGGSDTSEDSEGTVTHKWTNVLRVRSRGHSHRDLVEIMIYLDHMKGSRIREQKMDDPTSTYVSLQFVFIMPNICVVFPYLYHLSTFDQRCLPTRAVCALCCVRVHSFNINF